MLGLITLAETAGGSSGDPAFARKQIIDGQQRIITLSLILAAAQERLADSSDARPANWLTAFWSGCTR